jgi:LysM repeat protein
MRKLLMAIVVLSATSYMAGSAKAEQKFETPNDKPNIKTHTVVAGDSLSKIAQDNNLDSWVPLWNANTKLADPNIINPGDELIIPDGPTTDRPLPVAAAAPAAQPASYQLQVRAATRPANYSPGSPGVFERIRQRESGGNYATNTGNGYYGAYQFDDATWGGYGGYKHASDAPPAVQDAKAADTYARRGCSPWPNTCR